MWCWWCGEECDFLHHITPNATRDVDLSHHTTPSGTRDVDLPHTTQRYNLPYQTIGLHSTPPFIQTTTEWCIYIVYTHTKYESEQYTHCSLSFGDQDISSTLIGLCRTCNQLFHLWVPSVPSPKVKIFWQTVYGLSLLQYGCASNLVFYLDVILENFLTLELKGIDNYYNNK